MEPDEFRLGDLLEIENDIVAWDPFDPMDEHTIYDGYVVVTEAYLSVFRMPILVVLTGRGAFAISMDDAKVSTTCCVQGHGQVVSTVLQGQEYLRAFSKV